jgi:hypothetical protein
MNRHRLFTLVATVVLLAGALIVSKRNDPTPAAPYIPPQAQGFASRVPDPAFYQDAETASEERYPPQAQGFIHPVVDPAFYQDTTPAAVDRPAVLGTAWKLAVSIAALGLILALGLVHRKRAMLKLAGA